jgi:hypothetical protein
MAVTLALPVFYLDKADRTDRIFADDVDLSGPGAEIAFQDPAAGHLQVFGSCLLIERTCFSFVHACALYAEQVQKYQNAGRIWSACPPPIAA